MLRANIYALQIWFGLNIQYIVESYQSKVSQGACFVNMVSGNLQDDSKVNLATVQLLLLNALHTVERLKSMFRLLDSL